MKRVIFLHGVGSSGRNLLPLAEALDLGGLGLAAHCPDGPEPFPGGGPDARQWFSVTGVTEANRPARVAAALPRFNEVIASLGDPADSVLVGFSQGTIMSLHAIAAGLPVAGVIGLSGRLACPVPQRPVWPKITLFHGNADSVISIDRPVETEIWLSNAGAAPDLRVFDGLGHSVDQRVVSAVREQIRVWVQGA